MPTTLPNLPNLAGTNVTPNVPAHVLSDTDITIVNSSTTLGIGADRKVTLGELKSSIVTPITNPIAEAVEACATTAGDNVFSGKNSFAKTLGFSVESFGSSDKSQIPERPISKDAPAVYKLTGYGLLYGGNLVAGYPPVRCTVINVPNKGLYIDEFTGTLRMIWPDGSSSDITASAGINHQITASIAELIWDGSVLNVVALSGVPTSVVKSGDFVLGSTQSAMSMDPEQIIIGNTSGQTITLGDPGVSDGESYSLLKYVLATVTWAFSGAFTVHYFKRGDTNWIDHTSQLTSSLANIVEFRVTCADGAWWIREV